MIPIYVPVHSFAFFLFLSITSACITPNGFEEKCKPLVDCPHLHKNALEQGEVNFDFTYDSLCGWFRGPYVCCGNESDYTSRFEGNLPRVCGKWVDGHLPPWVAVVLGAEKCLGSFINEDYLITKASCVVGREDV